jgi:hypothetical protein
MPAFAHTPYDGSKTPFSIGLETLDLARWIEPDENLVRDLDERERLLAEARDVVFVAEPGTEAAQSEVWDLLSAHLPEQFPVLYRKTGEAVEVLPADRSIAIGWDAPIIAAARLVQEDLVLMRKGPEGYRLVAAVLCFPSFWSLREKFGATLDQLHAPVPGYQERLGARMNRIFDHLKVEMPVWRVNWSISPDCVLHQPESRARPRRWLEEGLNAFVRVERQTLRRLPKSGDILFTIKLHADPITALAGHPRGGELALSLASQIEALDEAQLQYKNLVAHRDALVKALRAMAAA